MTQDKEALETGIAKAKGDLATAETTAKVARAEADRAWSTGKTDTEGRKVIMAAQSKAESAESGVSKATATVKALEAALVDLGKQGLRDSVEPVGRAIKVAILDALRVKECKALTDKSPGLAGYAIIVNLRTESGVPDVSFGPNGDWFVKVKAPRKSGGGGNGKGQKYTYTVDKEGGSVTYATAREFIDSADGASCISPERRQAVTEGKAGATAVANAGAKVLGIMPVMVEGTPTA